MTSTAPIRTAQQLGTYVKALRKAKGLTQSDVARMLGVSKMRVATIEKDIGRVSTASVIELVHLLGGSILLETPAAPVPTANQSLPQSVASPAPTHRLRGEW